MSDALERASRERQAAETRNVLVMVTDGLPINSSHNESLMRLNKFGPSRIYGQTHEETKAATLKLAAEIGRQQGINIYTVGFLHANADRR